MFLLMYDSHRQITHSPIPPRVLRDSGAMFDTTYQRNSTPARYSGKPALE